LEHAAPLAGEYVRRTAKTASSKSHHLAHRLERRARRDDPRWVGPLPMMRIVNDLEESLKKYPPIKMGTPGPYQPPN
jgi:hypothetical protein